MKTFHEWLESRQIDDYVNQTLAMQLNKLGITPLAGSLAILRKYGYAVVDPSDEVGTSMGLPGDYTVIAGDDGYALFNPDDGQWMPLPKRYVPQGSPSHAVSLGDKAEKVPEMPRPTKYDFFEPTTPTHPVGSGRSHTDDSWYDRPKLKRR